MYVEYAHQSEILYKTVKLLPELQIQIRSVATGPETPLRLTCAVSNCEQEQLENAMTEDTSIAAFKQLDCRQLGGLYWIETVPGTPTQRAYEAAIDAGGVYLQSQWRGDNWSTAMNYPDQESFQEFRSRLEEVDIEINPTLLRPDQYRLSGGGSHLTQKQEAVLVAALEVGYFDIPRDGSLTEIADELGISKQAASERLRRAMASLAQGAVGTE